MLKIKRYYLFMSSSHSSFLFLILKDFSWYPLWFRANCKHLGLPLATCKLLYSQNLFKSIIQDCAKVEGIFRLQSLLFGRNRDLDVKCLLLPAL